MEQCLDTRILGMHEERCMGWVCTYCPTPIAHTSGFRSGMYTHRFGNRAIISKQEEVGPWVSSTYLAWNPLVLPSLMEYQSRDNDSFSAKVCYIYVSISKSLLKYTLLSVCLSRHIPSVQSMLKNERQKNIAAQTLGIYLDVEAPFSLPKKGGKKETREIWPPWSY